MWIEKTFAPAPVDDFVRALADLAARDLGIARPTITYFREWTPTGEFWRDLPDGDGVGGFAMRGSNEIALKLGRNPDTLMHVVLHEVRHLAQTGSSSPAGEIDACTWAHAFERAHFEEILELMTLTRFGEDVQHLGVRDHDCTGCAMAAEARRA